jgi:hypothetical protein
MQPIGVPVAPVTFDNVYRDGEGCAPQLRRKSETLDNRKSQRNGVRTNVKVVSPLPGDQ